MLSVPCEIREVGTFRFMGHVMLPCRSREDFESPVIVDADNESLVERVVEQFHNQQREEIEDRGRRLAEGRRKARKAKAKKVVAANTPRSSVNGNGNGNGHHARL